MRLKLAITAVPVCLAVVPAAAQESAASSSPEQIIVTARFREENLQTIPVAASVVGNELLEGSYTVNTQQLTQLVPSLFYNSANPRNTAYTIRGLAEV